MVSLLEQELNRYKPTSFWKVVQLISFVCSPFLASYIGRVVWSEDYILSYMHQQEEGEGENALQQQQYRVAHVLLGMNYVVFIVHNIFLTVLYMYNIAFFEQYKVHPGKWQWEIDGEQWPKVLRETFLVTGMNLFGVTPLLTILHVRYFGGFRCRLDGGGEDDLLPSTMEIVWQVFVCMVLEDFVFHHVHQWLHSNKLLYTSIHKVHHRYSATFGLATVYVHPIEYVLGNVAPSAIGPMVLGNTMHAWTMIVWGLFRMNGAVENHSGYEFPWSIYQLIPFKAPTDYHDFHHSVNQQNYSGVLRFWDWVYGTNQYYFEYKNKQQQQQQLQQLKQE